VTFNEASHHSSRKRACKREQADQNADPGNSRETGAEVNAGSNRPTIDQVVNSLASGRHPCPGCHRKGLGYAPHRHAFGHKDHHRARCRYCKAAFRIRPITT
jgi:hypothetical protein